MSPLAAGCGEDDGQRFAISHPQEIPHLKKLQERYGRFHARFPLDDVYLALPRAIRNDAYLYLLALSGNQRADEADRSVPLAVANSIATMMGLKATRMLEALAAIKRADKSRIVEITSTHAVLLKHDKWQDTPEEIAELKQKRSRAGSEGAAVRWGQSPHIKDAREPMASAMAPATATRIASAIASANGKNGKPIAETEIETELLTTPPTPSPLRPRQSDVVQGPDEGVVLVVNGMAELLGRVLSGVEIGECQAVLNQYAYLDAGALVQRAQEHQDWCRDNGHPIKRTVGGFTDTWRRHNDHLADSGQAKVARVSTGRTSGLSRLGDDLKEAL